MGTWMLWSSEYGTHRCELKGPAPVGSALLLLGPYAAAMVAVVQLLSGAVLWVSAMVLLAMGLRVVWIHLRPRGRSRVRSITLAPGGRIQVRFADGRSSGARLRQGAVVPGACLLVLTSRRGALPLLLPHYRMSPAERRWLRRWLRHGLGTGRPVGGWTGQQPVLPGGPLAQVAEWRRWLRGKDRGSG